MGEGRLSGRNADPWQGLEPEPPARAKRRRATLGALMMAVVVVMAATWFANASSVREIADAGASGIQAETALAAATEAQATVVHATELAGSGQEELTERALSDARLSVVELDSRTRQLTPFDGPDAMLPMHAGELVDALTETIDQLETDGEVAPEIVDEAEAAYLQLANDLTGARDDALEQIILSGDEAGQLAFVSRIVVAVVIPLSFILLYRFAAVRATKRKELKLALEHERKMLRSKDELIANISHELRTPLTGILGFAQMAALDTEMSSGELRTMAGMVATQADELARMVDDLITTARDNEDALALSLEAVDPNQELAVVGIPVVIAGYDLGIQLDPGPVLADRLRLRQIMRNLLSNALKYGGPNVRLVGIVDGDAYHLSVVDDGEGVSSDLERRLFTRFVHKGDQPLMTGSVGLGLSIARRLAEIMDGTLAYDRRGPETWFTVTLPLAPAEEGRSSQVA